MSIHGILFSQIGYDCKDPKRVLVRSGDRTYLSESDVFDVTETEQQTSVFTGQATYWGEKWNSHWWVLDVTSIDEPGEYAIRIRGKELPEDVRIRIDSNILWSESIERVALDQMETRAKLARNEKGWKDCGHIWREANSHATTVIGLCDLLNIGYQWLGEQEVNRLVRQLIVGCDYLAHLQDQARKCGFPDGAVVHEIPHDLIVIPGDVAQFAVALTLTSKLISEHDAARSEDYLQRAVRAFDYLLHHSKPYGPSGFSHWNHGAPEDFEWSEQYMTRDLLMMQWGAVELWAAGQLKYQAEAVRLARQVMKRQVRQEKDEGGYYGHFYTFDRCGFTEKANIHHHIGHDTGGTFPYYIIPFMEMASRWHDHPDAPLWQETVRNFAYGFFKPACYENPFYLIPMGYFIGEGILQFSGPWHGINTSIAFGATLASKFEMMFNDPDFRQIATGNIQWIAGLHAGITQETLGGSYFWKEDIPEDCALSYSQIHGVGRRSVGNWTGIPGTIVNGFSVNPQFEMSVRPSKDTDGPVLYTDEDWIPHGAGWASALTWRREAKQFLD